MVEEILNRRAAETLDRFNGTSEESGGNLISAIKNAIHILAKAVGLNVFSNSGDETEEGEERESEENRD